MKLLNNRWFLLGILALTWGSSFILIKKSVEVFSPYQVGALRVGIAGLLLLPIGIPALKQFPLKTILWIALAGLLGNFLPMFLFPLAEVKVSSSVAGILNSLVPLFVILFGFLIFNQKSTFKQVLGAMIGFMGAYFLMQLSQPEEETNNNIFYALLIVLATATYGLNVLIVKQHLAHLPSFKLSAAVFTVWFFPSAIILTLTGFFNQFDATPNQLNGLLYIFILAFFGTAIAMILFYKLIQITSTVFASSVTYLMPIIAVLWGVVFGEKFTIWHIACGVIILIGVYLTKQKNK